MKTDFKKATVLWTGGKDSSLALYEARLLGYEIVSLATFVPSKPAFLAHPLCFMTYQAESLGLPHYTLEVNEPYKESYEAAMCSFSKEHGIDVLVTGDIAEVGGQPNWIRECSAYSGVDVLTPLWGCDRSELLQRLLSHRFRAVFSCVAKSWFTDRWVGMELDTDALERLQEMHGAAGIDICGEQGEYHTLVLDGPIFQKRIHIETFDRCSSDSLLYMAIRDVALREK